MSTETTLVSGPASAVRELESRVAEQSLVGGAKDRAALSHVASNRPISFQFHWRGRRFVGSLIHRPDTGSQLAVTSHFVAGKPEAASQHSLVFLLTTHADNMVADLKLIRGGEVVLGDSFALRCKAELSVDNLVTKLTAAVLVAAPYLDLLSEAPETAAA